MPRKTSFIIIGLLLISIIGIASLILFATPLKPEKYVSPINTTKLIFENYKNLRSWSGQIIINNATCNCYFVKPDKYRLECPNKILIHNGTIEYIITNNTTYYTTNTTLVPNPDYGIFLPDEHCIKIDNLTYFCQKKVVYMDTTFNSYTIKFWQDGYPDRVILHTPNYNLTIVYVITNINPTINGSLFLAKATKPLPYATFYDWSTAENYLGFKIPHPPEKPVKIVVNIIPQANMTLVKAFYNNYEVYIVRGEKPIKPTNHTVTLINNITANVVTYEKTTSLLFNLDDFRIVVRGQLNLEQLKAIANSIIQSFS